MSKTFGSKNYKRYDCLNRSQNLLRIGKTSFENQTSATYANGLSILAIKMFP